MPTPPRTMQRLREQSLRMRQSGLDQFHRVIRSPKVRELVKASLPCLHRGELVTGLERERLGLSHARQWFPCGHPEKPIGEYVCPCNGCGPSCKGYTPEKQEYTPPRELVGPSTPPKLTWAYGVTTVPSRRDDLLPLTLMQLRKAGFDYPRLFVDGADDSNSWAREFGLEVTTRWPKVQAYANWLLSLTELFLRDPAADRYAIFQDDFVTCFGLREYLEGCPYPSGGGYLNLFTFMGNETLAPGFDTNSPRIGWYPSNQFGRGAVGLVFDRAAVKTLLTHPAAAGHLWTRAEDRKRGVKAIDGGLVTSMTKAGLKEYVHHPSLVQHVGEKSAIGNKPHPLSKNFAGENFDARTLLKARV